MIDTMIDALGTYAQVHADGALWLSISLSVIATCRILYMLGKLVHKYVIGEDCDQFSDIFDSITGCVTSSHPVSILMSLVVYAISILVIAVTWTVLFPMILLFAIARRARARNLEKKEIMSRLKG